MNANAERPSKRTKPSASKQGQTLTALSDVGEGTKSLGESLNTATAQEQERSQVNQAMLKQYESANNTRTSQQSQQVRIDAAEALGNLTEFEALEDDEQFVVQEWIDNDTNAVQVLKTIPAIRGKWLKRKLGDIGESYENRNNRA
jgi:hypothetical protein